MISRVTERTVSALQLAALRQQSDQFLWDNELRGLGVKATAHGHVSFVVQKQRRGKSHRVVVGHWPAMKVKQAIRKLERRTKTPN